MSRPDPDLDNLPVALREAIATLARQVAPSLGLVTLDHDWRLAVNTGVGGFSVVLSGEAVRLAVDEGCYGRIVSESREFFKEVHRRVGECEEEAARQYVINHMEGPR